MSDKSKRIKHCDECCINYEECPNCKGKKASKSSLLETPTEIRSTNSPDARVP